MLRFMLKATKWLHRDGYAALAARLRGLQLDMGRGFATQLQQGPEEVRRVWVHLGPARPACSMEEERLADGCRL